MGSEAVLKRGEIDGVLFDLDDTLVSSSAYWARRVGAKLARTFLSRPVQLLAVARALHGFRRARESTRGEGPFPDLRAEVLRRAARLSGTTLEFVREHVYPLIYEGSFHGLADYRCPGIRESIHRLKRAGLKIGILSDYPTAVKLRASELDDLPWDLTMDAEEVGALKPSAHPFRRAAERLQVVCVRLLYVGDRGDTDVDGALGAGLRAAQVRRPFKWVNPRAELVLDTAAQLVEALGV